MTKNEVLEIMAKVCRSAAYTADYLCDETSANVRDDITVPIQGNRPLDEYLELCADWAENELRK